MTNHTFDGIKQFSEHNVEFWSARELQPLLEYATWDKFRRVIEKASEACKRSGHSVSDHFSQVGKMVGLGSGAQRTVEDFRLSRYACYLVVQNGDPSKPVIANGQTYFAIQTRRQEIGDGKAFASMVEDQRRLMLRGELTLHNKKLSATARSAGVQTTLDYAVFQDHGYRGLYGGLGAKDIHVRKSLKKSQKILDHMGSTELAANLFRATQTEEKLRRDGVQGKRQANQTHFEVGGKVRDTIRELGGTMPEALPTPETSIRQITRDTKKSQS
ncbi:MULTISPECIES: DNA damage-inducible protein D [unclassified Paraburkholderia]|uniref:DNA damage-inducible protein D n=1 Tax=unclassified Paraburkholderia TaxID=2615204 RepID=UPI000EAFAD14|nr:MULTISPECIES: DNA damage-inducible protein D [unclassified Paraburkholderia]RKR43631.1 DNA-damage-inducible protein D [Paraburkholderia sp. BL17N1]TDY24832.1 DNA-damage-inducible protein D [Paraburkholderia sp. BL6665CI2N2]